MTRVFHSYNTRVESDSHPIRVRWWLSVCVCFCVPFSTDTSSSLHTHTEVRVITFSLLRCLLLRVFRYDVVLLCCVVLCCVRVRVRVRACFFSLCFVFVSLCGDDVVSCTREREEVGDVTKSVKWLFGAIPCSGKSVSVEILVWKMVSSSVPRSFPTLFQNCVTTAPDSNTWCDIVVLGRLFCVWVLSPCCGGWGRSHLWCVVCVVSGWVHV